MNRIAAAVTFTCIQALACSTAVAGTRALHGANDTAPFRASGGWDLQQAGIIGVAALILAQAVAIVALLFQRGRRRKADTASLDRQQQYLLAATAGAVGVWDWNFETGELFVDAGLKSLLGFHNHEVSTRPDDWGSRVHPQDLPAAAAAVQACIDGTSNTYEVEHRMLHKDGSVKWMLSRGSALRTADGKLQRLVGTKVDITDRKHVEDVLRESEAVLQASNREIKDLAGRLIAAQEAERARLARDLHDDLSQQIAGLSISLSSFKRRLNELPNAGELPAEVSSIQQRAIGLAEDVRRLSHDLHPTVLENAGLVAALGAHCEGLDRQDGFTVNFSTEGDVGSTTTSAAMCLYRVAQEALRNVSAHAGAQHVDVRLQRIDDRVQLAITDDGKGFDIVEARSRGTGLGLVSIHERVRLAGGTVSIVTELHKGTRMTVQIPAKGVHAAAYVLARQ